MVFDLIQLERPRTPLTLLEQGDSIGDTYTLAHTNKLILNPSADPFHPTSLPVTPSITPPSPQSYEYRNLGDLPITHRNDYDDYGEVAEEDDDHEEDQVLYDPYAYYTEVASYHSGKPLDSKKQDSPSTINHRISTYGRSPTKIKYQSPRHTLLSRTPSPVLTTHTHTSSSQVDYSPYRDSPLPSITSSIDLDTDLDKRCQHRDRDLPLGETDLELTTPQEVYRLFRFESEEIERSSFPSDRSVKTWVQDTSLANAKKGILHQEEDVEEGRGRDLLLASPPLGYTYHIHQDLLHPEIDVIEEYQVYSPYRDLDTPPLSPRDDPLIDPFKLEEKMSAHLSGQAQADGSNSSDLTRVIQYLRERIILSHPFDKQSESQTPSAYPNGSSEVTTTSLVALTPPPPTTLPEVREALKTVSPYTILKSHPSPRLTIPNKLLYQIPDNPLQETIMASWKATEPTVKSREYVTGFLARLSNILNGALGDGQERFQVDVFGSVSWGGESGVSGDLDLVVLDRQLPQGYHPSLWRVPPSENGNTTPGSRSSNSFGRIPHNPHLPKMYDIMKVAQTLRWKGMDAVQPITGASCPIVKFVDPRPGGMNCDININDLGGWYNSSLILHYCLISPYLLRPLIHALKSWLSSHDINDPSGSKGPATMSSYCLTLMVIAYLQIRGCLPNLQHKVSASDQDKDVIWVGWNRDQGVKAHVGFEKSPPEGWTSTEPDLTVSEALRGFFAYFSRTTSPQSSETRRFNYDTSTISILHGGKLDRAVKYGLELSEEDAARRALRAQGYEEGLINKAMGCVRDEIRVREDREMGKGERGVQPRNWGERRLVVQDPFLWSKNCAGSMPKRGLERWQKAIDDTHLLLSGPGGDAVDLKAVLLDLNPLGPYVPRRGRGGFGGMRGSPGRGSPGRGSASPGRGLWR